MPPSAAAKLQLKAVRQTRDRGLAKSIRTVMGVVLIPISIGGWGLREAAVVSLLSAHGVAREQTLLFSLFFGLVFVISAVPGGVCLLYAMPAKSD